jgi:hypothetical protein
MNDEYGRYTELSGLSSWYDDQPPARAEVAHLCPECRDRMSQEESCADRRPTPKPPLDLA